jgi:hypothetical protein
VCVLELTGSELTANPVDWLISNKYYSATVSVGMHDMMMAATEGDDGVDQLMPMEAVVFLYLENNLEQFEKIKNIWKKLVPPPEVCLVVAVGVAGEGDRGVVNDTSTVIQWCVANGLELVEWDVTQSDRDQPSQEYNDQIDDKDDEGVPRISQALQAHTWPQMTLNNGDDKNIDVQTETKSGAAMGSTDVKLPQDLLLNDMEGIDPDPGDETFEELFGRFADMKAHAESLPHDERKAYAEKVVMSFWKAIGGDEEEIINE